MSFKDDLNRRCFVAKLAKTCLGVSFISSSHQVQASETRDNAAKHLIYLYMGGGMSQLDTLDPKPGHENQGPTKAINTNVDGIQFSSHLKRLSRHADKMAVIRSMYSTAGVHLNGSYLMRTGYEIRNTIRHPGMGAWAQKFKGKINPDLPSSVFIGRNSKIIAGGGFFEAEYEPLHIMNPNDGLAFSQRRKEMTQAMLSDSIDLMHDLDSSFEAKYKNRSLKSKRTMYDEALKLMSSKDLRAFDLSSEPQTRLKEYGDSDFGRGCALARRLVTHGVRSVEVTLGGWDTHVSNFEGQAKATSILDQGLAALIKDLDRDGMLKDTLIVLTSEFGRNPRINQNMGRDHYPQAFSAALIGGGIKGGTVYGKTSPGGEQVIDKKVKIKDFNATIAYGLGIPLNVPVLSPSLRPFNVANKGKAITSLFEA